MQYIIIPTLSGSCLFLFFLCSRHIGKGRITKEWERRLLMGVLFFYLFPMPFLQGQYVKLFHWLLGMKGKPGVLLRGLPESGLGFLVLSQIPGYKDLKQRYKIENIIYKGEDYSLPNGHFRREVIIFLIWALAAVVLLLYHIVKYIKTYNILMKCNKKTADQELSNMMLAIKQEYGVRHNVSVYLQEGTTSFTMGIFKPIIIVPQELQGRDLEFVLRHELIHIEHHDMLIHMFVYLVKIFHWFNPLIYWAAGEIDRNCELVCDLAVVKTMTAAQREAYAKLLVRQCTKTGDSCWGYALSENGRVVKERVCFIMQENHRKWQRLFSAVIVCMAIVLDSFTVMAYNNPISMETSSRDGENEQDLEEEVFWCTEDYEGELDYLDIDEVVYNKQFTDEAGNIYPINEEVSNYALCKHDWIEGRVQIHRYKESMGCSITVYKSKKCTKGDALIKKEKISSHSYEICPHDIFRNGEI